MTNQPMAPPQRPLPADSLPGRGRITPIARSPVRSCGSTLLGDDRSGIAGHDHKPAEGRFGPAVEVLPGVRNASALQATPPPHSLAPSPALWAKTGWRRDRDLSRAHELAVTRTC